MRITSRHANDPGSAGKRLRIGGARARAHRWYVASLIALLPLGGALPRALGAGGIADVLLFDADLKELQGPSGTTNLIFTFAFTNAAPGPVVIESVRTSCGCTVARVPALPWTIPPGGPGEFSVSLDARGKRGTVTKSVFVNTSMGVKPLTVRAILESAGSNSGMDDRARNMQLALADRFAIFRGECASCHVQPAVGKSGVSLYLAACGICHESHNRASMVPDLRNLPHPTDRDHWLRWITFGRHGSMMPPFAQSEGGPLSDAQIDSLADYLTRTVSNRQVAQTQTAPQAARPRPTNATTTRIRMPPLPGEVNLPSRPVPTRTGDSAPSPNTGSADVPAPATTAVKAPGASSGNAP